MKYPSIEFLYVNQLPANSKICLFGADGSGLSLRKQINNERKDIAIPYFIDSFKTEKYIDDTEIINIENLQNIKNEYD